MTPDPNPPEIAGRFRAVLRVVWGRLLTGIVVVVPLVVTIWVLKLAYGFIDEVTAPVWKVLGISSIPGLGFLSTIALLIFLGFMATHVLGRRIIESLEALILRIPLISPVYSSVKQALESFKGMKSNPQFKRVAYIEYPSEGCLLVGFVTGQCYDETIAQDMTMVFLPTSPNPLTGFVVAVPNDKVIESGLTLEQASKIIISGGLVAPQRPPGLPVQQVSIGA